MAAANVPLLNADYFPTYITLKKAVKLIVDVLNPGNHGAHNAFKQAYRLSAADLLAAANGRNMYCQRKALPTPEDLDWTRIQKEMNATAIAEQWASNSSSNHPTRANRNRECSSFAAKVIQFAINMMNGVGNYVTFANRTLTPYRRKHLLAQQANNNALAAAQQVELLNDQLRDAQLQLATEQADSTAALQRVEQLRKELEDARNHAQLLQGQADIERAQSEQLLETIRKEREEAAQKMSEADRKERQLLADLRKEQGANEAYATFLQRDNAAGLQYLISREQNTRELTRTFRSLGRELPPALLGVLPTAAAPVPVLGFAGTREGEADDEDDEEMDTGF